MNIEFAILDFGVLTFVAIETKRDGYLLRYAMLTMLAWLVLFWGIGDFAWHTLKDSGVINTIFPNARI